MSHETVAAEGRFVYTMPALPSDVLRHREFQHFFREYRGASFSVQTGDGWCWSSSSAHRPEFTATFSSRAELDAVINDSTEDSLSRMFLEGKLNIQGELFVALSVAEYVLRHSNGLSRSLIGTISHASLDWMKGLKNNHRNSSGTDGRFNSSLFGLPVDLFQPWLGSSLGHFCARFRDPMESLEDAQQHALEQVCSALKLEQEDRFLDMSCGWGSVLIYAASEHGVRGQGIAFSQEQSATVEERLRQSNLHRKCAVECRTSAEPRVGRTFEKIIDIGVFDQVAHSSFRSSLDYASHALVPGGLLLMHRTTRRPGALRKGREVPHLESAGFGELPLLSSELQIAESSGYQILSVEDLSENYQWTMHHWIERLRCYAAPPETVNRQFRSWLFCLLDTAAKLDVGEVQLEQILLRRAPHS